MLQMNAPAVNASVSTPQSAAYLRPDLEQKTERDRAHVVQFLKNATCYAIMPDSGKVQGLLLSQKVLAALTALKS